jgi:sec-independent protein translocase protein TatA
MPMGGTELLIILAIILLFFGAKRVPELGRSLGKSIREFRVGASGADEKDEAKQPPEEEGERALRDGPATPSDEEAPRTKEEERTVHGAPRDL